MSEQLDVFQAVKADHRALRDLLLRMRSAFEANEPLEARHVFRHLDLTAGPHLRFEEESLYAALRPLLGDYMDKMLHGHDGMIATMKRLDSLVGQALFSAEEVREGIVATTSMLPHVNDCDGLAIFMEKLSPFDIARIARNAQECRLAGPSLLHWADTWRQR